MKRKFLIILLSVSSLSFNLFATGQMKCTGKYCIVDISKISPDQNKKNLKKDSQGYTTVIIDNMQTIVFSDEKYVMTQIEIAEYDLEHMQKNLLLPSLNSEDLPNSDYLCEDNLKPVPVAGVENTYECT